MVKRKSARSLEKQVLQLTIDLKQAQFELRNAKSALAFAQDQGRSAFEAGINMAGRALQVMLREDPAIKAVIEGKASVPR